MFTLQLYIHQFSNIYISCVNGYGYIEHALSKGKVISHKYENTQSYLVRKFDELKAIEIEAYKKHFAIEEKGGDELPYINIHKE